MSRILFACYDPLEKGTVGPVARRLRDEGHDIAYLNLWPDEDDYPHAVGVTFRVHKQNFAARSRGPLIRQLLPVGIASDIAERLVHAIQQLRPMTDRVFPLDIEQWTPRYRHFVDQAIANWKPDVVVLSLGQLETLIVRQACAAANVACLYLLTPFYEFKSCERLFLSPDYQDEDEYCVTGPIGQRHLVRLGVPESRITITGSPQLQIRESANSAKSPSDCRTILYADQQLPDNRWLGRCLIQYVESHLDWRLIVRLHPVAAADERAAWKQLLEQSPAADRLQLSPVEQLSEDDLAAANVVISISSLMLGEALGRGIPAICWHPGVLPLELRFHGETGLFVARNSQELGRLLTQLVSPHNFLTSSNILTGNNGPGEAVDRICDRILAQRQQAAVISRP